MIDLSNLGGGGSGTPQPGTGAAVTPAGPAPLPTLPSFNSASTQAPSSPDGDNHNWVWDQFGRAVFGSQEEDANGQHGGLLGDVPGLGALARVPGAAVRGISDAGGVGLDQGIIKPLGTAMSRLPSTEGGLGDVANAGKVNAWDTKYNADTRDPVSVGTAGFALAQDIQAKLGGGDLASSFLVMGQWMKQYDPEAFAEWQKTLSDAQKDTGVGSSAGEKFSHFIRTWSVNYADMTPEGVTGWFETHPELAFGGEGSFGQGFADDLARIFSFQTHAEKGAATLSGSQGGGVGPIPVGPHLYYGEQDHGSRLNELLQIASTDPKSLTPVEEQAIVGVRSLGWSDNHAYNFLIAHGQGYSSNPGVQTVLGMALDPTMVAGLGATAPGLIAAKAAGYEGVRAGLGVARSAIAEGRLGAAAKAMTRVMGSSVAEVRANPILGPASKIARTLVDPLSSIPGAKGNALKDVYSAQGLSAWERGFGAPAVADAARRAANWGVREVFDRGAASSAMNWARKFSVGRHIDNLAAAGKVSARQEITEDLVKFLGENSPKDAVSRMADYVYSKREFWLSGSSQESLVRRIMTTTGRTLDEVTQAVKGMSRDEQAVWHDISYREAWGDFANAVSSVDPQEWGALAGKVDDLAILNSSELDNLSAQALHKSISGLLETMTEAGKKVKAQPAKAIEAWNEAASKYGLIENLGRVKPNAISELGRKLSALDRIIQEGGLHTALDIRELKGLPESFTRDFLGKWGDQWRFGFKPKALQASGLVYDAAGELVARYEPSIGNVVEGIAKPARGFMPITDAIGRHIPGPVERVADSVEVAFKVARDSVSAQRVMTSMEQSFTKQMREAGHSARLAKQVFKVSREYVSEHGFTLAGMGPEEFWKASGPVLKDVVDESVAKRDIFNMLITSAGGDMRLLGLSSGMTQRIRAGLLVRGLNPDNYLGVITSKTYSLLRYALNPTFFLQAEFDAPWFNMYRGVMFDLRGGAPKPGTRVYEMQSIAQALSRTSLSRDLAMDYTERSGTIGFQQAVADGLKAVPGLEANLSGKIKQRLGRMVMNNELLYINSKVGDIVVDAVETTRKNLLKKAAEAASPEEAAVWSKQAERMDIEHVFDHLKEQLTDELGRMPTKEEVGRRYLSEMIDDSRLEVRTKEGLLDFSDHMKKAGYFDPNVTGKLTPLDLDYGSATLGLPNVHSVKDLREAMARDAVSTADIRDAMKAAGYHKTNIDRFIHSVTFNWRTYFDGLRRDMGMSRFEMQGIEDMIGNEAKAHGLKAHDYLTQVLSINGVKAAKGKVVDAAAAQEAQWVAREAVPAPAGMHAHTVANGGGTFDVATGQEMGLKRGYGVGNGPRGIVVPNTKEAVDAGYAEVSKTGAGQIGTWVDPATGMVSIDPTQVMTNKAAAIRLARSRGEKAIFDFSNFSDIQTSKEVTDLGLSGHMQTVLDVLRAAKKGEAGMDDMAKIVASNLHPSMKERLLNHFMERITGPNGLIEQAMARGDAKAAQDLNRVLEDLRGGWGDAADRQFKDLVVKRAGGDVSAAGDVLPQPWKDKSVNAYADYTERVPLEDIRKFMEIDREVRPKVPGDHAHLDELTERIRKEGFTEPATMEYDAEHGLMLLGDGNHRLAVAQRLGLDSMPVRVIRTTGLDREPMAKNLVEMGFEPKIKPKADGYFPADAKPSDLGLRTGVDTLADPEVERAARYFSQYIQTINPHIAAGEVFKDIVDQVPVAGGTPYDFTQAAITDTLVENFRLAEKDAIRLAHMSTERTVFDRSLNHPFFAMYPTSYFWGKVIPETLRFMGHEPFGLRTGAATEAYLHVKQSVDLQSQYDPRMKDLWDKVGKSAVLGAFSYASPSMPWEDMKSNLPPWLRALGKGEDFGTMLDKELDTFAPHRWISHFTDAGSEVGDWVKDAVTPDPTTKSLQDVTQAFDGQADPSAPASGFKGTVKGTGLAPILTNELADLQAALSR